MTIAPSADILLVRASPRNGTGFFGADDGRKKAFAESVGRSKFDLKGNATAGPRGDDTNDAVRRMAVLRPRRARLQLSPRTKAYYVMTTRFFNDTRSKE